MITPKRKELLWTELEATIAYTLGLGFSASGDSDENTESVQKHGYLNSELDLILNYVVFHQEDRKISNLGFAILKKSTREMVTSRTMLANSKLKLNYRDLDLKWDSTDEVWRSDCHRAAQVLLTAFKNDIQDVLTGKNWYTFPNDWREN